MADKITKQVIKDAMPNARIVKRSVSRVGIAEDVAVTVTPSAEAMVAKWGSRSFVRSHAVVDSPAATTDDDSDVAIEVVEINDTSIPASLRQRTVLVDKKKRRIVASSG